MARPEALDGAGACQRERTDWTFSAGDRPPLESAGNVAAVPERALDVPPLTRSELRNDDVQRSVVPSSRRSRTWPQQFSDVMIGDLVCSNRCGLGPRPLAPWRGGRGPRWPSWGDVCSGLRPRRAGLPRHGREVGDQPRRRRPTCGSLRREGTGAGPGHGRIPYQRLGCVPVRGRPVIARRPFSTPGRPPTSHQMFPSAPNDTLRRSVRVLSIFGPGVGRSRSGRRAHRQRRAVVRRCPDPSPTSPAVVSDDFPQL